MKNDPLEYFLIRKFRDAGWADAVVLWNPCNVEETFVIIYGGPPASPPTNCFYSFPGSDDNEYRFVDINNPTNIVTFDFPDDETADH